MTELASTPESDPNGLVVESSDDAIGGGVEPIGGAPAVPDYIARAIEAQGETTVEEVRTKMSDPEPEYERPPIDLGQEPLPDAEPVLEQAELDVETCHECGGLRTVHDFETHSEKPCPKCAVPLPDPGQASIGQFSDPERSGAPDTQRLAAVAAYPRTGSIRFAVLVLIARSGARGRTDEEIERELGLRHQSASARRYELMHGGWIEDSKIRRRTSSGREAVVWILSASGREQYVEPED